MRTSKLAALFALACACSTTPYEAADPEAGPGMDSAAAAAEDAARVDSLGSLGSGRLKVTMVDVGQGDGILVQLPSGKTLVVDGGPRQADFEAYLKGEGIGRVDYAVLSHAHVDHYNGLTPVLPRLPGDCAARVFDPGFNRTDSQGYQEFRDAAGCRLRRVGIGQTLYLDPQVEVTVMSAYAQRQSNDDSHGINNTSVVLRLRYGRFSMLLQGDAETEAEQGAYQRDRAALRSTVLKAGHHGSCTASGNSFLRAVAPQYVLISAAPGNSFGLPHCQTMRKLRSQGLRWARTDKNGTVSVVSDGYRYYVQRSRGAESDTSCPRDCNDPQDF